MAQEILLVFTAIVFYLLGRFSGREKQTIEKTIKDVIRKNNRVEPGVINYPSAQELKYRGSKQEEIDRAIAQTWKKAGL